MRLLWLFAQQNDIGEATSPAQRTLPLVRLGPRLGKPIRRITSSKSQGVVQPVPHRGAERRFTGLGI